MMHIPAQCESCIHYKNFFRCNAFPEYPGIPREIDNMRFDHRNPYPGDNGIRWEPKTPDTKHPLDKTNR